MATTHIGANKGDVAKTVLMPGDPLRAKFIAENFLEDAFCFNEDGHATHRLIQRQRVRDGQRHKYAFAFHLRP